MRMKSPDKGAIHHSRGQAHEGCAARGKRTKQTAPDKGATTPCTSHNFFTSNKRTIMSYFRLLYHIVFRTKYRHPTIVIPYEKELYNYIWGFIKNKDSKLYRIGGMPDHLHLLLDLSAKLALADFMRDLKTSSAKWLKTNTHFPAFQGWGNGYAAFTYNIKEKDTIVNYIMNQKEHHARVKFEDEIHDLFQANGCGDMEKYFLEDN